MFVRKARPSFNGRSEQTLRIYPSLEGWLDDLPLRVYFLLSSLAQYPAKQGREELLTAAVERGPSEGARSGSKESSSGPCTTPRVARAQETV